MDEHQSGHSPCQCGEFTHIFRAQVLKQLPRGYSGELCPRCDLWMCRLDKIEPLPADVGSEWLRQVIEKAKETT